MHDIAFLQASAEFSRLELSGPYIILGILKKALIARVVCIPLPVLSNGQSAVAAACRSS